MWKNSILTRINRLRQAVTRRFVAIDFDSRRVRMVYACRSGAVAHVLRVCKADVPADVNMADPVAAGAFLRRTFDNLGLPRLAVLMNVPRGQAVLKPLTLPATTAPHEIAAMVRYQVEKELPFPPEEAIVDYTLSSHYGGEQSPISSEGINVLVAAVRLPVVEYYKALANQAGLQLVLLGLRPYADMACVQLCVRREPGESIALVHINFDETEIDVLSESELAFTRSAPCKIDPADARGIAGESAVEAAAVEVARTLQSYQAVHRGEWIGGVLVAGDTGIEDRLAKDLHTRLDLKVEVLQPALAMGLLEEGPTGGFIAPIGLAIGQARRELPFDFLNPKRPAVQRDIRKIRIIAAAAAGAIILAALLILNWVHLDTRKTQLLELQSKVEELKKKDAEVAALAYRVGSIENWTDTGQDWLAHWAHLSEILPSCKSAYLWGSLSINLANGDRKPGISKAALAEQQVAVIRFDLRAKDSKILEEVNQTLLDSPYGFTPGDLEYSKDDQGYLCQTSIELSVPRKMKDLGPPPAIMEALRPADDASGDLVARSRSSVSLASATGEKATPIPVEAKRPRKVPAAENPPAETSLVTFDQLARGAAGLESLAGKVVSLRARPGKVEATFVLSVVTPEAYECYRLEESAKNPKRYILGYFRKGSEVLGQWKKLVQDRAQWRGLKVQGRAYFTGVEPKDCPVGIIVEKVQ